MKSHKTALIDIVLGLVLITGCQSQSNSPYSSTVSSIIPSSADNHTQLVSMSSQSSSVQQVTPTPVGIVVIQGNDNLGRVQLFTLDEIMVRTGILAWRQAGWTGHGQKIGVLDREFGGLEQFESSNQLTVGLMLGEDRGGYSNGSTAHGTQVLEILHTIAPGAALYACRYERFDQFTVCIDWMIASGVKIINHSAGVPALPLDGTNEWAREADRASRAGILWVNAAGNFAQGMVSDFFTDNNINTYHEFRGVGVIETLAIESIEAQSGLVMLSWDSKGDIPANAIDFDLEILDANDQVIASSTQRQQGNPGETAIEYVVFPVNQRFGIRVRNVDSNGEQVKFVLFIEFASLPGALAQGSIISPGDSQNVLTVGGLQGNVIAPYSSQGPLITGAIKPDLAAPAEVQMGDGSSFVGTSASAPIVAGVAALIWEANPSFTRDQLFIYLRAATQDDNQIPGPDSNYGLGRLYLLVPKITPTPAPATPIPTATPEPTGTATLPIAISPTSQATSPEASFPVTPTRASDDEAVAIVKNASVNLRSGPGTNYEIIGSALQGDRLPIISQANDWYLVSSPEGQQVWIWSKLVEVEPSDANIQIAATVPASPSTEASITSSGLSIGKQIVIAAQPSDGIALMTEPMGNYAVSTDGFVAGGPNGMTGTIIGGPVYKNEYEFFQITLVNGDTGWVISTLIQAVN